MTPTAALRVAQTPEEAAYIFLEQARQQLANGREITPLAVLVCEENNHPAYDLVGLAFSDESRNSAFRQVVTMAKNKTAKAIITIAAADYYGAHNGHAPEDCIFVTVSGEGIETLTMRLPFTRGRWRSKIKFGDLERKTEPVPLAFLPDWP
ncbi:MAG: hypothetical protein ACRD3L_15485 [Terriglobales bacterium]